VGPRAIGLDFPAMGKRPDGEPRTGSSRVLTIPNLLSAIRILMIPVFVVLLADEDLRLWGFVVLGLVQSTDWVDGYIARRTSTVTTLGKVLDPVADRLAVAAALITFVVLDLLPLWAALLVLLRDGAMTITVAFLALRRLRIDVRWIGKAATFTLMWGIPMIAWGNAGLLLADAVWALGWIWFSVGVIEYYAAALVYATDVRAALAERR
jgi:cardiolipin synthase (CMP-forming)